jgi:hypothetical protein
LLRNFGELSIAEVNTAFIDWHSRFFSMNHQPVFSKTFPLRNVQIGEHFFSLTLHVHSCLLSLFPKQCSKNAYSYVSST